MSEAVFTSTDTPGTYFPPDPGQVGGGDSVIASTPIRDERDFLDKKRVRFGLMLLSIGIDDALVLAETLRFICEPLIKYAEAVANDIERSRIAVESEGKVREYHVKNRNRFLLEAGQRRPHLAELSNNLGPIPALKDKPNFTFFTERLLAISATLSQQSLGEIYFDSSNAEDRTLQHVAADTRLALQDLRLAGYFKGAKEWAGDEVCKLIPGALSPGAHKITGQAAGQVQMLAEFALSRSHFEMVDGKVELGTLAVSAITAMRLIQKQQLPDAELPKLKIDGLTEASFRALEEAEIRAAGLDPALISEKLGIIDLTGETFGGITPSQARSQQQAADAQTPTFVNASLA